MFFQPELEAAIHRYACVPSGVAVERGWVTEGLEDSGDHVELTLHRVGQEATGAREGPGSTGQFAPGGWSGGWRELVRSRASAVSRRDLGFQERSLVVDAAPHDMGALSISHREPVV